LSGLLIAVFVGVVLALYGADRVRKARAKARRLHVISDRLAAAAARVDKQQEQRRAAAQASASLTSVIPAISLPPLTAAGSPAPGPDRVDGIGDHTGEDGDTHTGEHLTRRM
jgi:hypothetical protein